ncbi:MAG TPA: hypothetical protein VK338_04010 [Candidatus Nitrosocosmicus sp.]|nr:hypothetical protein [Candidatus Nitrosocosmicus sp.]
MNKTLKRTAALAIALTMLIPSFNPSSAVAQADCVAFQQTGQSVCGRFLQVWKSGRSFEDSLYLNGYPLTAPRPELSQTDGKVYTMQWFERARYEMHPQNQAPHDVQLGLLGTYEVQQRTDPEFRPIADPRNGMQFFAQTGHTVGDTSEGGRKIAEFWSKMGGLAQFGLPLSQPTMQVTREEDQRYRGKAFLTQYFERQRFEYHPENAGSRYEILLGRLGAEQIPLYRGESEVRNFNGDVYDLIKWGESYFYNQSMRYGRNIKTPPVTIYAGGDTTYLILTGFYNVDIGAQLDQIKCDGKTCGVLLRYNSSYELRSPALLINIKRDGSSQAPGNSQPPTTATGCVETKSIVQTINGSKANNSNQMYVDLDTIASNFPEAQLRSLTGGMVEGKALMTLIWVRGGTITDPDVLLLDATDGKNLYLLTKTKQYNVPYPYRGLQLCSDLNPQRDFPWWGK